MKPKSLFNVDLISELENHKETIELKCATCGDTMHSESESDKIICFRCNKETSKEQLISDNHEAIEAGIEHAKQKILDVLKKSISKY